MSPEEEMMDFTKEVKAALGAVAAEPPHRAVLILIVAASEITKLLDGIESDDFADYAKRVFENTKVVRNRSMVN